MPYVIGDRVDPFTLPRAEGGEFTLDPTAGPATVIAFTSNHCPYALAWHERLQAVARDFAPRGVAVVQINSNDETVKPADSTAASAQRVRGGQFAGPYLRDADQRVARAWGAQRTPDVYVLDQRGVLVYHGAPDASYEDEAAAAGYVRDALADVLAGRPVAVAETPLVGCTIKWSPGTAAPQTVALARHAPSA